MIVSLGRKQVLSETLASLAEQSLQPHEAIVVCPNRDDAPEAVAGVEFKFIASSTGLCVQRNTGVAHVSEEADVIAFLDDDVQLASDYFAQAAELFQRRPSAVLLTGKVVADGVRTGSISRESGRASIAAAAATNDWEMIGHAYGCNMLVRAEVARAVPFDENLPLYAWLEDRDFSRRASRHGEVGRYGGCLVAHLGTTVGRLSGRRFGYSQIVNPVYLKRKGTMSRREVGYHLLRALAGAVVWRLRGDDPLGRSERLGGVLSGLRDVLAGRADPRRVLEIA